MSGDITMRGWRQWPDSQRVRCVAGLALVTTMLTCLPLWSSNKEFPTVPVAGLVFPVALETVLLVAGMFAVVGSSVCMLPRWVARSGVSMLAILMLGDVNRLQPWMYQGVMLLGFLAFADEGDAKQACCAWLACTYIWSGLHKFNFAFEHDTFGYLMKPIFDLLGEGASGPIAKAWFMPAVIEASLGIGLLIGKTQRWAAAGVALMHLFLLLLLGPLGRDANSSVWPWNIGNALLVLLFFWPSEKLFSPLSRPKPATLLSFAMLGVMPVFNMFGNWPAYLSANLYTGNVAQGFVVVTEDRAMGLPDSLVLLLKPYESKTSANLAVWSLKVQNAPVFPEPWALKAMASKLCRHDESGDEIELVLFKRPGFRGPMRQMETLPCCSAK